MFAECCVFDKQSPGPIHCAYIAVGPLLPKLRGDFAKFLNESSLARLSVLTLEHLCRFTVRVLYLQRLEDFLGTVASETYHSEELPDAPQSCAGRIFLSPQP